MSILNYIEKIKQENEGPRITAQEPRNMYAGGQLVRNTVDGSRPGYSGDYTAAEKKKQGRTLVNRDGKLTLDLHTPELKKWYKKNYPDKSWWDQKYKSDILDRYYNELGREKPPKGYITTKEYAKKYGFKIYPATDAKAEGNIISNLLRRKGDERAITRGYDEKTKNFFSKELEPKSFKTTYELAPGKKSSRELLYVKDKGKIHANNLLKYWDGTQLRDHTVKNIDNLLKDNSIKKLFEAGNYNGIKKALMNVKGITDAERANVMLRIAQGMSGHSFRDYKPNIELNKVAANRIFKGFEKEPWHTPFSDGYINIKRNAIMKDLGDGYFTKSYKGFIEDARGAIKKALPSLDMSKMDINELTGLTSGYKNKTFTSTQFVNLMDSNFNQRQHASMIKVYGEHEARLQKALSGKRPNYDAAANEVQKWKAWKKDFFDNLDPRYKTEQIKSILPDFKITDKASKVFTEKRLADFRKQNFPIEEEIKKMKYVKTAGTKKIMSETPLLREVAAGDSKAMERIKKQLISLCPRGGSASGGRIGYKAAGAVTGTLECGLNQFNKNMKTGNANSALMRRVLANGGNILKGAAKTLNPAELLRFRNLIGPQALGFFAAYEAGDITDDILRKNIPVNEALSKNWLTKTFLPYREQGARAKNLLQSGKLTTDAQKKYALDLMKLDQAIIKQEQLEQMKLDQGLGYGGDESGITPEKIDAAEKDLERRFSAIGDPVFTEGSAIGQEYQALEDEMIASRLDKFKLPFQSDKGTRLVNKLATPPRTRTGPMTAKREMKIDYSLPTYDRTNITEQDVLNMYKDEGWISPTDYKSGMKLSPGELTWWKMQIPGRGIGGTQVENYMGGGIVGIRKPHAIPPERQGLRSIMINGKKS